MSIVLYRIDDRLIHGQVVVGWGQPLDVAFIVLVDDGHGPDDLLHLVIETRGYRREDAKDKKLTMETYWVPGVNNLKSFGRWVFVEFSDVFAIEGAFGMLVQTFASEPREMEVV